MRRIRYVHACMPGHSSLPASAYGTMPAALSLSTSASNSSHVAGGAVMPAWVNRSLLYQKPIIPRSQGTPYCLPLYWYWLSAPGLIVSFHDAMASVMSWSLPASAWAAMVPPPHDWKRSGMSLPCMVVASLDLKASFSRTVMLILTLG